MKTHVIRTSLLAAMLIPVGLACTPRQKSTVDQKTEETKSAVTEKTDEAKTAAERATTPPADTTTQPGATPGTPTDTTTTTTDTTKKETTEAPTPSPSSVGEQPAATPGTTETTPPDTTGTEGTKVEQPAPSATAATETMNLKDLTHENVRQLQTALNQHGAKLQVDGIVGPQTRKALSEFQTKNNLAGEGKLTRETVTQLGLSPETIYAH